MNTEIADLKVGDPIFDIQYNTFHVTVSELLICGETPQRWLLGRADDSKLGYRALGIQLLKTDLKEYGNRYGRSQYMTHIPQRAKDIQARVAEKNELNKYLKKFNYGKDRNNYTVSDEDKEVLAVLKKYRDSEGVLNG